MGRNTVSAPPCATRIAAAEDAPIVANVEAFHFHCSPCAAVCHFSRDCVHSGRSWQSQMQDGSPPECAQGRRQARIGDKAPVADKEEEESVKGSIAVSARSATRVQQQPKLLEGHAQMKSEYRLRAAAGWMRGAAASRNPAREIGEKEARMAGWDRVTTVREGAADIDAAASTKCPRCVGRGTSVSLTGFLAKRADAVRTRRAKAQRSVAQARKSDRRCLVDEGAGARYCSESAALLSRQKSKARPSYEVTPGKQRTLWENRGRGRAAGQERSVIQEIRSSSSTMMARTRCGRCIRLE